MPAQLQTHSTSAQYDSTDAPSTNPIAGFHGAFRQQILIAESRLLALRGKSIRGIWLRRDTGNTSASKGGLVDMQVQLSPSPRPPELALAAFSSNQSGTPLLVYKGRIAVPNLPAIDSAALNLWSQKNSVRIAFSTPYSYRGGTLCIEFVGRPVARREPDFWFADFELGPSTGAANKFGKTCSKIHDKNGHNLTAEDFGLQPGGSSRVIALGKPGSTPLMLIGVQRLTPGLDLSAIGATGCFQYVRFLALNYLKYYGPVQGTQVAFTNFEVRIPNSKTFLGASVFVQFADIEIALPRPWTTSIGLTTSNGLELKISSLPPSLGMSIVRSRVVGATQPMPSEGEVNVRLGPVLRLLY